MMTKIITSVSFVFSFEHFRNLQIDISICNVGVFCDQLFKIYKSMMTVFYCYNNQLALLSPK